MEETTTDTSTNSSSDIDIMLDTTPTGWYDYSYGLYWLDELERIQVEIEKLLEIEKFKSSWNIPKKIPIYRQKIMKPLNLRPMKTSLRPRWFPRRKTNKNMKHEIKN